MRKDILVQMNLKCELGTNMNANVTLASGNCGAFQTKPNASNWENKLSNRNYSVHSTGGSQNCAFFIQSFNRENLKYAVRYKQSMNVALEEITNLIKSKFVFWFLLFHLSNNICTDKTKNIAKTFRGLKTNKTGIINLSFGRFFK